MKTIPLEPAVRLRKDPNRWFGFGFMRLGRLEIPRRLRALVRARESSLIALAVLVGAIAGLVVAVMGNTVDLIHEILFHLQPGERLSARLTLDPALALSVPLLGGLLFGAATEIIRRWRPEREVDPAIVSCPMRPGLKPLSSRRARQSLPLSVAATASNLALR